MADRFTPGTAAKIDTSIAALRGAPSDRAGLSTQLLFGEGFTIYETRDGWAWGQAEVDGYVGYVRADCLRQAGAQPSHWVRVPATLVFPAPDLKTPPLCTLSLNARVEVLETQDVFTRITAPLGGEGWVHSGHLADRAAFAPDYLATAGLFLGAPYLWGGRCADGLDCSGLVQTVLLAAGHQVPRDSDQQAAAIGHARNPDPATLKPGDFVFFPGHVAIMESPDALIHANARDMAVTRHLLTEFLGYLKDQGLGGLSAVRRIGQT